MAGTFRYLLTLNHLPELGGSQPAVRRPAGHVVIFCLAECICQILDNCVLSQFRPAAHVADRLMLCVEQDETPSLPRDATRD